MTQQELKKGIIENKLDDSPLVLKYEDIDFICMQYAKAIAKNRHLKVLMIDDLGELDASQTADDIFDIPEHYLYIYEVEELNVPISLIAKYKDLIIITKKIPASFEKNDFIEIEPLANWQIEDFLKVRLPGLLDLQIKWLCSITNYNIYKLDAECRKIELFPSSQQQYIFDLINNDNGYANLTTAQIFDLTNAVMKGDTNTVGKILSKIEFIDVEPVGLATIFKSQIRKIIDIQLNPKATPESLGMLPNQFNAIKHTTVGLYTTDQLLAMYEFLTDLDYQLKIGNLQFVSNAKDNTYNFIDYIIAKMLCLEKLRGENSL